MSLGVRRAVDGGVRSWLGSYGVRVTAAATPDPRHGRRSPMPPRPRCAPRLIPEEAAEFDQQWREVMARATETLDLAEVLETLEFANRLRPLCRSSVVLTLAPSPS
jgi:Family of unknown function (DUF6247)